jgi:hypothetical protein
MMCKGIPWTTASGPGKVSAVAVRLSKVSAAQIDIEAEMQHRPRLNGKSVATLCDKSTNSELKFSAPLPS